MGTHLYCNTVLSNSRHEDADARRDGWELDMLEKGCPSVITQVDRIMAGVKSIYKYMYVHVPVLLTVNS